MRNLNRRLVIDPSQRLQPEQLRPASTSGTTFVMPTQPTGKSTLGDLLTSLGSMSDTVSAIAAKRDAREQEEQTLAAEKEFDGMSLEQARELVATKQINQYQSPYFRAAFLARLGQNEAASRKRELVKSYESLGADQKIALNVEQFIDEQTRADLTRLPDNKFLTRAYLSEIEGFAGQLANKQVQSQVEEIAAAKTDQWQTSLTNGVLTARERGLGAVVEDVVTAKPANAAVSGSSTTAATAPAPMGRGAKQPGFDFDRLASAVVKRESNGDPTAVSPKGARGLMQVMPGTQRSPGFGIAPAKDDSEAERVRIGREYLQAMLKRYGGNVAMALAAYNAGPGRVDEWIKRVGDPRSGAMSSQEWAARIPIKETRDYVPAVLANYGAGADGATGAPVFMDDAGPLTLPDGTVVESVTQRLADPSAYATSIFETIEENATTGLATRREQEQFIITKILPALAESGKDAELMALLDHDRGPAGTLRAKLGPAAELFAETAKNKREASEDTTAAGQWEDTQYTLGIKADNGSLTEDDINSARQFAITDRVSRGRKPLAGGEYFAGLVVRQRNYFEQQAERARREAEKAAELAAEAARLSLIDQAFASGLGHELSPQEENEATTRAYERNRMTSGGSHTSRRALDLKTFQQTGRGSPFSQRLLERGHTALRAGTGIDANGRVSPQLALAIEEYGFLRRNVPNAIPQMMNGRDQRLFDTYFALTESGVMTSQQAMLRVQSVARDEFKPTALTSQDRLAIQQAIKAKSARNGVFGAIGGIFNPSEGGALDGMLYEDQPNRNLVVGKVEQYAQMLMSVGATPEAAVKFAIEKEGGNWTQFDGILVNHNGTPVPRLFPKGIARAVDKVLDGDLKGSGYDRADGLFGWKRENVLVQAHPNAPGKWMIYDRRNFGVPVHVLTTEDIVNAATEEANEPGLLDRITNMQPPIRLRRDPAPRAPGSARRVPKQ